jgi:hypothetical protein
VLVITGNMQNRKYRETKAALRQQIVDEFGAEKKVQLMQKLNKLLTCQKNELIKTLENV